MQLSQPKIFYSLQAAEKEEDAFDKLQTPLGNIKNILSIRAI